MQKNQRTTIRENEKSNESFFFLSPSHSFSPMNAFFINWTLIVQFTGK